MENKNKTLIYFIESYGFGTSLALELIQISENSIEDSIYVHDRIEDCDMPIIKQEIKL